MPAKSPLIRFWKPYGVLSQFSGPSIAGRQTLREFIPIKGYYPVGRLDLDSEGLLLLTNDGGLQHRLANPKYLHPKTYYVQLEGIPDEGSLDQLRSGILLKDGPTRPAEVSLMRTEPDVPPRDTPIRFRKSIPTTWIQMTITEGRNRQVRRMTAAVGLPTLRLIRFSIGPVSLRGLHPGQWEWVDTPVNPSRGV